MKNIIGAGCIAVAVLALSGCLTTNFVYPANPAGLVKAAPQPLLKKKVAILPFDDARNTLNHVGTIYLSLIPGYPYGYIQYSRPEAETGFTTTVNFNFRPDEDLAKAAALSVKKSNIFADSFFTYGGEKDKADFIFEGRIISTDFLGKTYSYGLPLVGGYLSLLGAPFGSTLNRLGIGLVLKDRQDKILWSYEATRENCEIMWAYTDFGDDLNRYPGLMQQIMNDAMTDLAAKIKASPEKFR